MKIALVTGSYPPAVCGAADYTLRLEEGLAGAGVNVTIYTGRNWSLFNFPEVNAELTRIDADILHVQYPTTGYGTKLGPQMLGLARPMVLTLHEASQAHPLRRLSLYPFTFRSKKIIFTNEYERVCMERMAPWIRHRGAVIPIGSNIDVHPRTGSSAGKIVTYFGLIRPQKGLEDVLELARLLHQRNDGWNLRILGTIMPGREGYFQQIRRQAAGIPIDWQIGLSAEAVSHILSDVDFAYLPFPDGASERRGSMISMLMNGAAVVTTRGPHTPAAMNDAAGFASSPSEALSLLDELWNDVPKRRLLQKRAIQYSQRFAWPSIIDAHVALYSEILRHK